VSLHDADRAVLAHLITRTPEGLSAVYEGIGHVALERAEQMPEGPERERWLVAWSQARDLFAETKRLGL
jgi:hypothetical protein